MLFGRLVSQDCVHHQEVGGNRRASGFPFNRQRDILRWVRNGIDK